MRIQNLSVYGDINSQGFSYPNIGTPNRSSFSDVSSWAYQLTGYTDNQLTEIANSNFDLVVFDLSYDGSTGYWNSTQIDSVKENKHAIAYFSIGSIENYRPEYASIPESLKLGTVVGWPNEYYVKYWDAQWWTLVVKPRIDQAISAGFDGAYLDMIVTYEEIPANSAGTDRLDLARKMTDLIEQISIYAKSLDPSFKIIPQNSPELGVAGYLDAGYTQIDANKYLNAIDGLGMENLYFIATDVICNASWCSENEANCVILHNAGKKILTVDYADIPANISSAYSQSSANGFVPYTNVVDLNILRINPLDPQ